MTTITRKAAVAVATVAAGLAGVASMLTFAPMAYADSSCVFTRDLTVGATGADVTCLQQALIAGGFSIPAGATGYFGSQTQAAVMAWQSSKNIAPAAGYFGPISRAAFATMAMGGGTLPAGCTSTSGFSTTTGQSCSVSTLPAGCTSTVGFSPTTGQSCSAGGSTTVGGLSGGEASLDTGDLHSGDGSGSEGESNVELASVDFDVNDGDVSIQRVELMATPQNTSGLEEKPWKYFDKIGVYADGKKLGDVDASDRDNWDQNGDDYTIDVSGLNYVVKEDDNADLSFMADISDSIDESDLAQEFELTIPDQGIRAVDSVGIQNYTDVGSDTVTFGFDTEDNGQLTVRESSDNPTAENLKVEDDKNSDEYTVFAFEVRNKSDVDTLLTDLTIETDNTGSATSTDDIIQKAVLTLDGHDYTADIGSGADADLEFNNIDTVLDGNSTTKATLKVTFRQLNGKTYADGDTISFSVDGSTDLEAEGDQSGDTVTDIGGAAQSDDFTLSLTGFKVEASSTSKTLTSSTDTADAYGTFTIKFDVTADEDNPLFIGKTAASSTATTGAVYRFIKDNVVYNGTTDVKSAILTSTAATENGNYRVDAGETETFTLTVTLDPSAAGNYSVELYQVHYSLENDLTPLSTYSVDTDDADFETDPLFIAA